MSTLPIATTAVDLMAPRYRIIADYPGCAYHVGCIFTFVDDHEVPDIFTEFPHLFQPLQWWEERAEGELPEYVKYLGCIYKCTWSHNYADELVISIKKEEGGICQRMDYFTHPITPSTREEYEAQQAELNDTSDTAFRHKR